MHTVGHRTKIEFDQVEGFALNNMPPSASSTASKHRIKSAFVSFLNNNSLHTFLLILKCTIFPSCSINHFSQAQTKSTSSLFISRAIQLKRYALTSPFTFRLMWSTFPPSSGFTWGFCSSDISLEACQLPFLTLKWIFFFQSEFQ